MGKQESRGNGIVVIAEEREERRGRGGSIRKIQTPKASCSPGAAAEVVRLLQQGNKSAVRKFIVLENLPHYDNATDLVKHMEDQRKAEEQEARIAAARKLTPEQRKLLGIADPPPLPKAEKPAETPAATTPAAAA